MTELVELEDGGDERRETPLERLDRNLTELVSELRVVSIGVQVTFAFLLIVPFSAGFRNVTAAERYVYFAILVVTAAAAGLLIAPTALHRLLFRERDKLFIVHAGNRMAIGGIACLTVAMTGILGLISGHLFGLAAGLIVAALAALFFGGAWFGLALWRKRARADSAPRSSARTLTMR